MVFPIPYFFSICGMNGHLSIRDNEIYCFNSPTITSNIPLPPMFA